MQPNWYPMEWIKLDRYMELSGDTMDAVQARRKDFAARFSMRSS
jgi:hypothetical protein